MSAEERVMASVEKAWKKPRTKRVGLGLSGGCDSIVLAEAMRRAGVSFEAFHFNHRWKPSETKDAAWVRRWCRSRGIVLHEGRAREKGVSSEAGARSERYDFFGKEARRAGVKELWLAHHGDDVAETFLLQLMRGAGPEGLASLHLRRRIGRGLWLVRPLLEVGRKEIRDLARKWKLRWREDGFNASADFARGRVRHEVLPLLDDVAGREVSRLLLRTVDLLRMENSYWEQVLGREGEGRTLSVKLLRGQHKAQARRLVRKWLLHHSVSGVGYEEVERVLGLVFSERPAKVNLSGERYCRRREGVLFLE